MPVERDWGRGRERKRRCRERMRAGGRERVTKISRLHGELLAWQLSPWAVKFRVEEGMAALP